MTLEEKWQRAYNLLIKYYKEYGDIYVPRDYIVDGVKLGKWFNHQREFYNKGKLSKERITKLNELSPNWHDTKYKKQSFDFYYNMLKKYHEQYGNIDVPANYVIDDVNLGMWLSRIRHSYKISNGQSLNQEEIDKLNELGINWMIVNSYPFEYYYSLLKEYRNKYGDVNVPYTYEIKGIKLGYWLSNQREAYKDYLKKVHTISMIITQEEIDKLNELGMIWSFYHKDWTINYNLLSEYYKKHGNINIPFDYVFNDVNLGYWLSIQRQLYSESRLPKARISKLNKYDIDWNEDNTRILNDSIVDMEFYNSVLNERINDLLNDFIIERKNKINSVKKQKQMEKELIKRIWR